MNAKKIMGAVLVALLAAALFVGAGAAAVGTLFVYQPIGTDLGMGVNGANTVTFTPVNYNGGTAYAIVGDNIVEGEYTFAIAGSANGLTLFVKYPTAVITGTTTGAVKYNFMGGKLYKGDNVLVTNATGQATQLIGTAINAAGYLLTENGVETEVVGDINQKINSLPLGSYKIRVFFDAGDFADATPENYLYGDFYSFEIVEADDATMTADVDTVLPGGVVKLTITAKPGSEFTLKSEDALSIIANQKNVVYKGTNGKTVDTIVVPNTGKVTVAVTAASEAGDQTITLAGKDSQNKAKDFADVEITIEKGTITAKAEKASYFVGDEITIIGTSTAGTITNYTLAGTNFNYGPAVVPTDEDTDANDFKFVISTADIMAVKKLDVGTYTLTLLVGADPEKPSAKATVAVVLKQPFISIIEAPEVIVQGDKAEFIVNAEATEAIRYYIFGTNYFNASGIENTNVKDNENQFKFTLGEKFTEDMDAGQYFMVIQHPMYDEAFNIVSVTDVFYLNTSGDATGVISDTESKLFNVDKRQTANAAQALCDALDTQNIDDMYVKYSFFVVGEDESFTLSEIPATIAQGETLTISGVSTANAGEFVTVEMISTAFAAVPKETVGSAAFIAVTTQIADDGTWEVTFDTSNLNVDEYSLKVACAAEEKPWKNVNINVVEAGDEPVTPEQPEEPEQPEQPEEPVAPATPGFGALAALAGLGAVAVLLLRRE